MIVTQKMAIAKPCLQKDKWMTPPHIFEKLNNEFHFTLDPCASEGDNWVLCPKNFNGWNINGLGASWRREIAFVNPPYSRGNIDNWAYKCYKESQLGVLVVGLFPVSTSANWWHEWVIGKAELRFVNKRIRFVGAKYTAPFSSVIIIWGGEGVSTFEQ